MTPPAITQRSFGIQTIQTWTWQEMLERWAWFEDLGWDSLWLPDHFVPTARPDGPMFEAWTLLAALATKTTKARLGVLVSSNTFRHPALLAKQAVTIDHISNGRMELGVGAGWFADEHEMFGLDFPKTGELVERYAEAIDLLDRYLSGDQTTFEGEYYTLRSAYNRPAPVQKPRMPLMLGAHGPRMIDLVSRYADTWNSRGTPEEMRERNQRMDEACIRNDRDPCAIKRSMLYVVAQMPEEQPWDSTDAFADFVGRFTDAGVQEFIFQPPPPDRLDIVGEVAREILPGLRSS
ncbi:MAG: LLM class flavin-dependent oxidoreductase [Chloroflexia bacterium]|jgi:alkanesulfonate monooxygenase SsuD/methylene tetrahydromethanopterin reductase-like flavin-dependent oxidoreductase (luciferase family)|nr:LLM class flavin-dependent oxidoreductase [Chloroflexia bacterium]